MSQSGRIGIKKHLLARRKGDLKLIKTQFERVWDRLESDAESLKLQASEYERRLSDLNHAHRDAETKARTYVTLDKYEDFVKSSGETSKIAFERVNAEMLAMESRLMARLEPLGRDLQARGTRGTTLSAGWAYVMAAIGAFVAVVSAGVAIWTVLTR